MYSTQKNIRNNFILVQHIHIRLIKRTMKKMVQSTIESPGRKEALINNVYSFIKEVFDKPITSKNDIVIRVSKYFLDPFTGENITKQTLSKGFFPRLSVSKKDFISAIKEIDPAFDTSKVIIDSPWEKSDFRFLAEYITTVRWVKSTPLIESVIMNSETPNKVFSEKKPDLTVTIKNKAPFSLDIKSGNNMYNVSKGFLGEIPYYETGKPYLINNNTASSDAICTLSTIQEERLRYIQLQKDPEIDNLHKKIMHINQIKDLNIFAKNLEIQNEILNFLSSIPESRLRFSFYYGHVVRNNPMINHRISNKISMLLTNNSFKLDTKKQLQGLLIEILSIYDKEYNILNKQPKLGSDIWFGTGFGDIDITVLH